jgi:riboflavin biosynthesis pyrimidine reductase
MANLITVGGPGLAAHALAAGLVDECHLFLNPVAVGGGTRALPLASISSWSCWTSAGSATASSACDTGSAS